MRKLFFILVIFLTGGNVSAQPFQELLKMVNSDREETDQFGYDVDIYGDYAVVGAYGNDFGAMENAGAAYVYYRSGINDWVEVQILTNSDQEAYDRFGWSVAIYGDLIVVGAYGEDEDEVGSASMAKAGSVYIFEKDAGGTWTEVQKIVASDRTAGDEFGWDVDLYDSTIVVGAHAEEHDEFGLNQIHHAGSVYIFDRDGAGVWNETQKVVASERAPDIVYPGGYAGEDLSDQFGGSVAIWNDYMVVGAHHHDYGPGLTASMWASGAAYIFERSGMTWTEVAKIQNFDREPWDRFGYAVDIDTNIVIVSSYSEDEAEDGTSDPLTNPGSVHIFERNGAGAWLQVQKIVPLDRSSGDHFGYSLDIYDTTMVIGTHSDNEDEFDSDYLEDAGSAYIFTQDGSGVWSQFQKLDASDRDSLDEFGISCTIWGTTVMVGAFNQAYNEIGTDSLYEAGAVYEFNTMSCEPDTLNQAISICSGYSYDIGGSSYTTSGVYQDIISTVMGCDSVVNTTLTVEAPPSSSQSVTICFGDTYSIGSSTYSSSGIYDDTLTAGDGCDSVVTTNLTVKPELASEQNVSVCWGESYTIGGSTYSVSGTYVDVLTSADWCDSVVTTNLTIELPLDVSVSQVDNYLTANQTGATYQWYNCDTDEIVVGATSQSWWAYTTGSFACIIDVDGCVDTTSCVHVSTFSTPEEILNDQIELFPNPSNGLINLTIPEWMSGSILSVHNAVGAEIYSEKINGNQIRIDLSKVASGVYHVRIAGEATVVKRVVIEN